MVHKVVASHACLSAHGSKFRGQGSNYFVNWWLVFHPMPTSSVLFAKRALVRLLLRCALACKVVLSISSRSVQSGFAQSLQTGCRRLWCRFQGLSSSSRLLKRNNFDFHAVPLQKFFLQMQMSTLAFDIIAPRAVPHRLLALDFFRTGSCGVVLQGGVISI